MKNLKSIILIAIITCSTLLKSQNLHNMVSESNYWYNYGTIFDYQNNLNSSIHIKYFFKGDTIINGLNYKKMFQNVSDSTYSTPLISQSSYYKAALRQDSMKVYFVNQGDSYENLYCDFNISVGDTLNYFYNDNKATVISIDSVPFGSVFRKKYTLSNTWHFYEGIGNELGLFHDFSLGIEGDSYLSCFQQGYDIENVYAFSGYPYQCRLSSQISTGIITNNKINSNLNVYPNPANNDFTIMFDYEYNNSYSIYIYDFSGKITYIQRDITNNNIKLTKNNLDSGIYFVKLIKNNNLEKSIKLIIQ